MSIIILESNAGVGGGRCLPPTPKDDRDVSSTRKQFTLLCAVRGTIPRGSIRTNASRSVLAYHAMRLDEESVVEPGWLYPADKR